MAGPGRPQYAYDGWSGVSKLQNNEPPLLQTYSNPKKCKLTVEVRASRVHVLSVSLAFGLVQAHAQVYRGQRHATLGCTQNADYTMDFRLHVPALRLLTACTP